jgi:amino acid adenylation domain-containing protein
MNEEMSPLKRALVALEEMDERLESMRRAATQPMAIVGAACRFPQADSLEAYWSNLSQGRDSVREIDPRRWDVAAYYDPDPDAPGKVSTRWGGFLESVDQFDADFFGISPREAEYIDPQHRLFLEVAWEALERARLTRTALAGSATGVFAAVCFHDYDRMMVKNFEDIVAYTITGGAPSMLANRLSYLLDLKGPSLTVDTACSSSLVAVHLACQSLRAGNCDVALVGGVNLLLDPATTIAASKFRMMSPQGRCHTFDARADGFVRGEGCGVVVLKRLADAEAAGDEVLAIVRGTAVNQDGRTNGLTAPNGRAQEQVIRAALRDGGVEPAQVGYIETHGTGTALGDPIEVEALMRVYDEGREPHATCQLGAVKTNIGHLEAAAGIAGLIKATLALRNGRVPGNLHFETLNPEIDADGSSFRFPTESVEWAGWPRFAAASSFGFGGTNAHVVLEAAAESAKPSVQDDASAAPVLLPISARREPALRVLVERHLAQRGSPDAPPLRDLACALSTSRTHMEHRLAVVTESPAELAQQLAGFLTGELPRGVFAGEARTDTQSVVFVFPGQGSQWFGMGRELFEHDAVFRDTMRACSAAIERHTGWCLLDELAADAAQSRMGEIDFVQPLLFAMSAALASVWRARGIEPDVVVGHSMGEVAAAYVAGALSLDDAARVICSRSRLMRRLRGRGRMAVTELSLQQATTALAGYETRVSIAASNGPRSTVLSGEPEALAEILAALEQKDIFCRFVEVDVASHSPSMEELRAELLQALDVIEPRSCTVPMLSTVRGVMLEGEELSAAYWFDNLREPVLFFPAVEQLLREGPTVLVECSPHPVLLPAVQEVVASRGGLGVASLRRNEPERRLLLESLAMLHVRGVAADFSPPHAERSRVHVELPTYPWQHEAFWFCSQTGQEGSSGATSAKRGSMSMEGQWLQPADDATVNIMQVLMETAPPGPGGRQDVDEYALDASRRLVCMKLAWAGLQALDASDSCSLDDAEFFAPVLLDPSCDLELQLLVKTGSEPWRVTVSARPVAASGSHAWQTVLRADYRSTRDHSTSDVPARPILDIEGVQARCALLPDHGETFVDTGDSAPRSLTTWRGAGELLVALPPHRPAPALTLAAWAESQLSATLESAALALPGPGGSTAHTWLLTKAMRLAVHAAPHADLVAGAQCYAHLTLAPELLTAGPGASSCVVPVDVHIVDAGGRLLAELSGAALRVGEQRRRPLPARHLDVSLHPLRTALLGLSCADARRELLELSIRQHVARVTKSASDRLDRDRRMELDSLMAMQVKISIQEDLGSEVPLAHLLRGATPRSLAAHLLDSLQKGAAESWLAAALPTIVPAPERRFEPFELTDLQQAYWLGRGGAFELGRVATYFFIEVDVDDLDVPRLSAAWNKLVARHPMLRAEFSADGRQCVRREVPWYAIEVTDLRSRQAEDRERELAALREERSQRVFAGNEWPLFELKASRLDDAFTRLHIGLDILIVDGWAISTLFREWRALYQQLDTQLPQLEVDFRDYVVAGEQIRRGADYARSLAYWKQRAKTQPDAPKLPMRSDRSRDEHASFVHRTALLDSKQWESFKESARSAGITPSTAIGAAYCEVLAAWSSSRHFTLNLLFFNRLPLHEQIEDVVGNFSTTMLLEVDVRTPATFVQNALTIQDSLTECLDHSLVNGVEVLREINRHRGWSGDAAMPVVFASALDTGVGASAKKLDVAVNLKGLGTASRMVGSSLRTPQVYLDHQIYEENGELRLNWDSLDALLPDGMIDAMWRAYVSLLERLASEPSAWQSVARLGMTPPADLVERARVNSKRAPVSESLLHSDFFALAERQPDAPAVISSELSLSYAALAQRATALAQRLRQLQVKPGELVAVFCRKSWEQVVAVLAIHAAGAGYLPIDPALPDQRVQWLLEDAGARIVVGTPSELVRITQRQVLAITEDESSTSASSGRPLPACQQPDDLAYVIYTSGSTGTPKGVAVSHRAALNTVVHVNRMFEVGAQERAFAISSLSFDLSVFDIFGPLSVGGAVVVPAADQLRSPADWLRLLEQSGVTIWSSVPALVEMLVEYCESMKRALPPSLKLIMMSGDWIPITLAERIGKRSRGVKVVSLGGATEAAIWSISHTIDGALPGWSSVPYGYPLPNQQFHVLDVHLEPCPVWVSGELYISGEGLAMHYWRDPKRTAERFIHHPTTGTRLYRTGDLGRYRNDGVIEFQGRDDLQVKVQGYRIELGEVEAALASHAGVRASVVAIKGERAEAKTLVGYWVAHEPCTADAAALEAHVAAQLPSYMVPTLWVQLPALPLSANGKVDRGALPDPLLEKQARSPHVRVAPRTEVERELHQLWASLLATDNFGVTDSFFELGGQSLLAMRLIHRIHERFGRALPVSVLFQAGTIEKLAVHLEAEVATAWSPLAALRSSGSREPFFCVHPVGGNVMCYRGLAERMQPSRPFFGLQARGLVRGLSPHETIEEAAREYVSAIREVQPRGPYYLGGWSLGGVVAFEMAQQLRALGEEVANVVMLDSRLPGGGERDDVTLLRGFASDMARLSSAHLELDEAVLHTADERGRFVVVVEALKAAAVLPNDMELQELDTLWNTYRVSMRALDRYRPCRYDGRVSIFSAALQPEDATTSTALGWEAFAGDTLTAVRVAGDHYGLLEPQNSSELARLIDASL